MPKLSPSEYRELKSFLRFFSERFFPKTDLPAHQQPIALLESMEATAPAKAAQGLQMVINDCLEMSSHWRPDKVSTLDAELKEKGIVSLSELRKRYSRAYAKLVKRGQIKSDSEYYLAKGILDGCVLDLSEADRHLLSTMLTQYEEKAS